MPYCSALDNHMCITVDSKWRPCCRFKDFSDFKIDKIDFDDYRNDEWYQKIKTDMKDGWADGCSKCKAEEERNATSLRKVFNDRHEDNKNIQSFEISLSNKCNLACRMCSPTYSTHWGKLMDANPHMNEWHHRKEVPVIDVNKVFNGINLRELQSVKYLGGEPFITPQIGQLFEYLENAGVIGNLELLTNTNCTLFPTKWSRYLKQFRLVTLDLSIDGIGPVNDYIRHGKTWDVIDKTIDKWCEWREQNDNIVINTFSTIQALNLHDVGNIQQFSKERNFKYHSSLLVVPELLAVHALPRNYLNDIRDENNDRYYASITDQSHLWPEFVRYNKAFDIAAKTNLAEAAPLLYEYMEKHNG